jgi:hypothetical protein
VLKLTACNCGARGLVRIDRAFWMRLVPTRRLYYCPACETRQFLTRSAVLRALASPLPTFAPVAAREVEPITRQMGESSLDANETLPARYV